MSPASDLRDWLVLQGHGTVGTVFSGEMPASPDTVTALRDTPGFPPQYFLGLAMPGVEYPGVQVSVRAPTKLLAETRAWDAWRKLAAFAHTVINTRRYEEARPLQTPFLLGGDASSITSAGGEGKTIVVFNVLAMRDGS